MMREGTNGDQLRTDEICSRAEEGRFVERRRARMRIERRAGNMGSVMIADGQ